ncbi:MAG: PKD domain-containing protein [Imperialibacter sp.]|uniref:PKD domain-containing protein n=1 Tax=Imperialibacter sp. TaxID=2038411 RepID=UPI0032ECB4DB
MNRSHHHRTAFLFFLMASSFTLHAQLEERDGREIVEQFGENSFRMYFELEEPDVQLVFLDGPGKALFLLEKGVEPALFPDPAGVVGLISTSSFHEIALNKKAIRKIKDGTVVVVEGRKDGNIVLIKIDVNNKTIEILQDFSQFVSSDLVDSFESLDIKALTSPENGKIYCLLEMTSEESSIIHLQHIVEVSVEDGSMVNLTEDYVNAPYVNGAEDRDFNIISDFAVFEDKIFFLKLESRPSDASDYDQPTQGYVNLLQEGSINTLHTFDEDDVEGDFEGFLSNGKMIVAIELSVRENNVVRDVIYLISEDGDIIVKEEVFSKSVDAVISGIYDEEFADFRIYNGSTYFVDESLYKIESDGTMELIAFPDDGNGGEIEMEFVHFDNNDDGLYFLGNSEYESGISENLGALWKYDVNGWRELKVKTTNKGLTSDGEKIYVSGLWPEEESTDDEPINIVGIYELNQNLDRSLHWYLRVFTVNLHFFDDKFYFQEYDQGPLALQPLYVIPLYDFAFGINISVAESNPAEGSSIQFSDNTLGEIVSWEWAFEGGTPATSQEQKPVITYETEGTYSVTVSVTFEDNSTKTETFDAYITVLPRLSSECPVPPKVTSGGGFNNLGFLGVVDDINTGINMGFVYHGAIKERGKLNYIVEGAINLSPDIYYENYELQYRPLGTTEWEILEVKVFQLLARGAGIIKNLEPKKVYEFIVRTKCDENVYSLYSEPALLESYAPVPILGRPSSDKTGKIEIEYSDFRSFDKYLGVELLFKNAHDEEWQEHYFDKGEKIELNVANRGYYEYKLRYHYRLGGVYSDYTKKDYVYVYIPTATAAGKLSEDLYAEFGFAMDDYPAGSEIQFADSSNFEPVGWQWEFEGGYPEESTEEKPSISYYEDGKYAVSLTATDANGDEFTVTYDSIVSITTPIEINANTSNTVTQSPVSFDDNQPEGYSRQWFFEGGTPATSSDTNPHVIYSLSGTFDVGLIVETPKGSKEYFVQDFIQIESGSGLEADFKIDADPVPVGNVVTIEDASIGNVIGWNWQIDGVTLAASDEETVAVTWEELGEFEVSLTVMDSLQNLSRVTKLIVVEEATGVREDGKAISIYPNPSQGRFEIKSENYLILGYNLIRLDGSKVKSEHLNPRKTLVLSANGLPSGVYLLQILLESGTVSNRIIVE